MKADRQVVLVWRESWLPGSETFIRNQLHALSRWEPLPVGVKKIRSPIAQNEDVVLFGDSFWDRVRRKTFRLTRRSIALDRLIRQHRPALIHAHFGRDALLIAPSARRFHVPLVVTFHGFDVTRLPNGETARSRRYRRKLHGLFLDAEALIAVSGFIRDALTSLGAPQGKIRTRPIGIPIRTEVSRTNENRQGLLFVGRLTEKKGASDLLQAIAILEAKGGAPGPLTIVGDGELRETLEAQAEIIRSPVTFTGALPPGEVRTLMEKCAVFCAPSKRADSGDAEGLGMVFLEAAECGAPIVGYRHGGVPEAVVDGENGLLADEGDVGGLADRLDFLLTHSDERERMSVAGRQHVTARFDVCDQTRKLEKLFDEVSRRKATRDEVA